MFYSSFYSEIHNLDPEKLCVDTTITPTVRKPPEHTHSASTIAGEAVNPDGTLKDASQIEWFHSPSSKRPLVSVSKRKSSVVNSDTEEETDAKSVASEPGSRPQKRRKVSLSIPVTFAYHSRDHLPTKMNTNQMGRTSQVTEKPTQKLKSPKMKKRPVKWTRRRRSIGR